MTPQACEHVQERHQSHLHHCGDTLPPSHPMDVKLIGSDPNQEGAGQTGIMVCSRQSAETPNHHLSHSLNCCAPNMGLQHPLPHRAPLGLVQGHPPSHPQLRAACTSSSAPPSVCVPSSHQKQPPGQHPPEPSLQFLTPPLPPVPNIPPFHSLDRCTASITSFSTPCEPGP